MTLKIAILGSTGSIGTNALRVIDALDSGYEVTALTAHRNVDLLAQQIEKYAPKIVAVADPDAARNLQARLGNHRVEILTGAEGLTAIAEEGEIDIVLTAVVGAAGLPSALAAARAGKRLAIANKEPLVTAGELLTQTAKAHGCTLLPVDSEHSAVFQALLAGSADEVERIILTGSGGPFRKCTPQDLNRVTREEALAHPTWTMGPKITIDSATMMNKALEIIEAHWLFDLPVAQIEILIHPESIIHSLVEFVDGSLVAQMGHPDMCLPIQYALTYPRRLKGVSKHLRLEELGQMTFESPNLETFRALPLAYEVARAGGTAPAVFNAANEVAVHAFLAGKIKFTGILELVEHCLDKHDIKTDVSLEGLLDADAWARDQARRRVERTRANRAPVEG
ncbi:MAG: 1-deoxy-D-xylulose-5-phosphate reductoisomerase [Planctomycetes bacterium]|nr:1-deoxy-D-xylulose-5-phosphate reductoisomerase [Planctomycetota bacterium]